MKRILLVTAILMANVMTMSAVKKQVIDRIEPTDWYVGMKNPTVQLMVYGKGIRDVASVTTDYPGVRIDSLVRLDSPNYLLIYMNLKDAQPGTMTLIFKGEKERRSTFGGADELTCQHAVTFVDDAFSRCPEALSQRDDDLLGHREVLYGLVSREFVLFGMDAALMESL